ncbi:MAG: hypothetical protein ABIO67_01210 [Mycobacteriales bacterium]
MSNLIPNENTWVGFLVATVPKPNGVGIISAPTVAEVGSAVDLTDFLVSLNASASGNTVPTPRLKSLFETSVNGTSTATFTGDFYRDDEADLAWDTLPRGTKGCFLIKRFGGTGTAGKPVAAETVEVWPVNVTSRAAGALTSGTAQMFTLTCSVPREPDEDAVVSA